MPVAGARGRRAPDALTAYCDDNTIGVVAVLGSTFDGSYEPVADIRMALDGYQAATGTACPGSGDGLAIGV